MWILSEEGRLEVLTRAQPGDKSAARPERKDEYVGAGAMEVDAGNAIRQRKRR